MSKTGKLLLGLAVVIVIIVIGVALNNKPVGEKAMERDKMMADGPIKIGFIGPLSGDVAFIGENIRIAIEIAVEEINNSGELQIEMIFEDGQCDGKAANNAANKLINIDKVTAIIGGLCSAETLALAPLAEAAGVPVVSPASTAPDVSDAGDYIFRVVPADSFQGAYAADLMKSKFDRNKVAILRCLNDWCAGVRNAFVDRFSTLGDIVAEEEYTRGDKDFRTQITKIKNVNPDAIYFIGYTGETVLGIQQMRELGVEDEFIMGADAWSDPKIWEQLQELANGVVYTEPANQELPADFVSKMEAQTDEINVYAPRGYDATYILAEALKAAGTNGGAIKDALYKTSDYEGIADVYSFDEKGDVTNALYALKQVNDGVVIDLE